MTLAPCPHCGHRLWSEVRSAGAFRFVAHFDDDEQSVTYAEHAPYCPGCGVGLDTAVRHRGDGTPEPEPEQGGPPGAG